MKNLALYKRAMEAVTFLFTTFGGLLKTTPPEAGAFASGIGSFLSFVILLVASILAKNASREALRKYWLAAGILFAIGGLAGAFTYDRAMSTLTFFYQAHGEEQRLVGGCMASEGARRMFAQGYTPAALLHEMGGLSHVGDIWDGGSHQCARDRLLLWYSILVICIASCVFSLVEAAAAILGDTADASNAAQKSSTEEPREEAQDA